LNLWLYECLPLSPDEEYRNHKTIVDFAQVPFNGRWEGDFMVT